jgi:hypothetical protein
MARTRLDFHAFLKQFCDNVYFQPPPSVMMKYPAIVYTYNRDWRINANNEKYIKYKSYQVTVIDRDPDSELSDEISNVKMSQFDRSFTSDNLNHFVYTIYF